jgi:hypothetical protein
MELSLCEWKIALCLSFWEARDDHTNKYKAADVSINMILPYNHVNFLLLAQLPSL